MPYMNTNIPELGGFDTGVVLENLSTLFARQEPWLEAGIVQLSELADAIIRDAEQDPDTLYSILLSMQGYATEDLPSSALSYDGHLRNMERGLGVYQKLLLYHFLYLKLGHLPTLAEHAERTVLPAAKGRIAYMNSAMVGKAYIRFAEHLGGCRAAEFDSFVDACEEVAGGLCEYCILPLYTSTDGQLMSFYRLIIKYRLQIVAVYDVDQHTGSLSHTTFGLLRSMGDAWDMQDLFNNPFLTSSPCPISLSVLYTTDKDKKEGMGDMLTVSEACGIPLTEAASIPYGEVAALLYGTPPDPTNPPSQRGFYFSFGMGDKSRLVDAKSSGDESFSMPQAFLIYMMVEGADHLNLGLYPHLS